MKKNDAKGYRIVPLKKKYLAHPPDRKGRNMKGRG